MVLELLRSRVETQPWYKVLMPGVYNAFPSCIVGEVEISPSAAAEILRDRNNKNRRIVKRQVEVISNSLSLGQYLFNGEPLVFDKNGNCRQGQHRLHAIVNSGVSMKTMVVIGIKDDVFKTFDQHTKRTLASIFQIEKCDVAQTLASAIPLVAVFKNTGRVSRAHYSGMYMTIEDQVDVANDNPQLVESARFADALRCRYFRGQSLVAALHFVFASHNQAKADAFFQSIASLAFPTDQPAYSGPQLLTQRLTMPHESKNVKIDHTHIAAITIKAWNTFITGRLMKVLRWAEGEEYPRVIGWHYNGSKPIAPDLVITSIPL